MTQSPSSNPFLSGLLMGSALLFLAPIQAGDVDIDWLITSHPCSSTNGTDALHRDSDGTLWVGCGDSAEGIGLFTSADGGDTWTEVTTTPFGWAEDFRFLTISRGHDGALYGSGNDTLSGGRRSLRFDTSGSMPYPTTANLIAGETIETSFRVGGYAELSDGRALASSFSSGTRLFRPDSTTDPSAGFWTQLPVTGTYLDLIVFDNAFYASGSNIAAPPRVYLPPQDPTAEPWELVEVILDSNIDGELYGIAANERRVVGVGVDQDRDVGKIFVSGEDIYDPSDYTVFDMPNIVGPGGVGTWARGVCMLDDTIVVVGERQPLSTNTGRVMLSTDGGISFSNITPSQSGRSISRCVIADGVVTVVGTSGYVGRYTLPEPADEIFMDDFEVNSYIPLR